MRKVIYITGTRADFGLMEQTLLRIHKTKEIEVSIIVTGMHLIPQYGHTVNEIISSGLHIEGHVNVELSGHSSGTDMSIAIGQQILGFTTILNKAKPDLILLLGDRGEMLAAAISAIHLNTPIVHIHGGELSGTVDESVRHAISKLSHYHFTATENSRQRLIKMGENPKHVFVTGAPGLDSIIHQKLCSRTELLSRFQLSVDDKFLTVIFHPVTQSSSSAGEQMRAVLDGALASGLEIIVLMPNSDSGSENITNVINEYEINHDSVQKVIHLERQIYLSLLSESEVLVGNSSSGIIEAASLGTPVVNVGSRQKCRERNENVFDTDADSQLITRTIKEALDMKNLPRTNIYGDGYASKRISDLLRTIDLDSSLLEKVNAY